MTTISGPAHPTNSSTQRGQPLTPREREVMDLLVLGMNNPEIAEAMVISIKGVDSHLCNIRFKTGLGRRVLLALWWHEHG